MPGLVNPSSAASTAGGANLQIPVSARAEGMGRAYAPLERSAFASWANPGGLGFVRGVSAVASRMRLVPDLAAGVTLDYEAVVMGVGRTPSMPVTVSLGFNHTGLDYGLSILTDPGSPDPIGTFESHEVTRGVTFAAGLMDIVGVGVGLKTAETDLYPGGESGQGRAAAFDYGILVRTPQFRFLKDGASRPRGTVVLTGGLSWNNRGGDMFRLVPDRMADPLPKVRREAVGVDIDLFPADRLFHPSSPWLSRLLRDAHLVSVSAALGREKDLLAGVGIPDSVLAELSRNEREGITNHRGIEVRFLDCIAVRVGRVNDDAGGIVDNTYGWGLSILGKVGVDYARIPQFHTLENVVKWSFWLRIPFDEAT